MWCGGINFILVLAFLTVSVLSHQSENDGGIKANNSLEFRTSSTDEMTTLIIANNVARHMEPDLHAPGNILFTDSYALRTTDGVTTTTLAGSSYLYGNTVAVGDHARFGSICGFRQISPTHVVVADHQYHCLRLVDRLTLQTPLYAGCCGSYGYSQGTTSARFYYPRGIIIDKKQAGMLLVTDSGNGAIRHVQIMVGSGLSVVSQFYKSATLDLPLGLAQDPISGDLYITTFSGAKVYRLTYTTRSLVFIAGSSSGFADGDFGSSRFNKPCEIIIIDNGTKLMLSDRHNHRVRLLDLITHRTSSICTGQDGHSDGDTSSCTLTGPYSLMVLNNTLYVGGNERIRKIQDECGARSYNVTPETGLAVVEVPGSAGKTALSLPPGTYQVHRRLTNTNCTFQYQVNENQDTSCNHQQIRQSASPDTGVAVVDLAQLGSEGQLTLPPGNYPFSIRTERASCAVNIGIADYRLRRRLVFQSQYDVRCEVPEGNIAEAHLTRVVASHAFDNSGICDTDCTRPDDVGIDLDCTNHTLTVVWPSNINYTGDVNMIPAELYERLASRIIAKGSAFYLVMPGIQPPIVFPKEEDNGGHMIARLSSYCLGENVHYVKVTDSCEEMIIPEM